MRRKSYQSAHGLLSNILATIGKANYHCLSRHLPEPKELPQTTAVADNKEDLVFQGAATNALYTASAEQSEP
jgi:hypothetical protein